MVPKKTNVKSYKHGLANENDIANFLKEKYRSISHEFESQAHDVERTTASVTSNENSGVCFKVNVDDVINKIKTIID